MYDQKPATLLIIDSASSSHILEIILLKISTSSKKHQSVEAWIVFTAVYYRAQTEKKRESIKIYEREQKSKSAEMKTGGKIVWKTFPETCVMKLQNLCCGYFRLFMLQNLMNAILRCTKNEALYQGFQYDF